MTEPSWRHIDSVTEEMFQSGRWQFGDTGLNPKSKSNYKLADMKMFCRNIETTQVYGPIHDPPKPPPKLRRFEATHGFYGRVSGVKIEGEPELVHFPPFWDSHGIQAACTPNEFTDIHWIDPE